MDNFSKIVCFEKQDLIINGAESMSYQKDWGEPELLDAIKQKDKVVPPSMYQVILNNDDYTPMEFVVEVLRKFFSMNIEKATEVMLTVHYQGKAVCATYTAEVAETKVMIVNKYARDNEHPLLCTLEKV